MPTTSTQTNSPWKPIQPYITYGAGQAKQLYAGTPATKGHKAIPPAGFNAPNFKTYVPFAPATEQSLEQIKAIANQGNPLAGQSTGAISGILSGDINNRFNQLYGQNQQDYGGLQGQYDTQMGQNAGDYANLSGQYAGQMGENAGNYAGLSGQYASQMGANAADYGGLRDQYAQLYQQTGNPYFEQAVQGQADKMAADVQRQFGGLGRIGSAADTGALVDQIGNMRTQALANNWNQNVANQRGILGDTSSLMTNYGGLQGNLLGGQANLYGTYTGAQGNLLGGQANLYGTYGGLQGNLLGGKGNLFSNYGSNQGNLLNAQQTGQLNAVGAAAGAYQQQYLPSERLGQVGAAREDLNQRALQSQLDKFNINQQAPWNRLNAYNQGISGTGGTSPGFAQQKVSQPTNWLGILAGGGLTAASLYGTGGGFSPGGFNFNTLFPSNSTNNNGGLY